MFLFFAGVVVLWVIYFVVLFATSRVRVSDDGFLFTTGANFSTINVSWPFVRVSMTTDQIVVRARGRFFRRMGVIPATYDRTTAKFRVKERFWAMRVDLENGAGRVTEVYVTDRKGFARAWDDLGWPSLP